MRPVREYMGDKRVAAALAAIAALAVGYRLVMSRAAFTPPAPADGTPLAEAVPSGPAATEGPPPPKGSIPAGWSGPAWNWDRNPFLPPSAADARGAAGTADEQGADLPAPKLLGTVAGGGGGSAIFRGQGPDGADVLVPAGGKIGGWTLASVEPYRVLLRRGGESRIVELYRQ